MRNSIRTRLTVAFIGLAIGPLLLVGVILAWQSFTTQQQQALNLQREVAQRVSIQVTAFFGEIEDQLRLVCQVQGLRGLDRNKQRSVLSGLLSYQGVFDELTLLDRQGQEQIRLSRFNVTSSGLGNRDTADEFVIPQTTGQAYYGPIRLEETTGEPLMTIAMPLLDARTGLADGVLVSEVRIKKIWNLIAGTRVSPGQSVYIVDAQGKVVAHRNPSVVLRGDSFRVPDHDGIQPGLAGSSVVLAVDKAHLGQQVFSTVAEQTFSEALALAINTVLITAGLVVAVFALSGTLGFVIVRQIVQPIQSMATTAQAISAGDLSQQVKITHHDELGVLANAFNNMTARLRTLIHSLEEQVVEVKRAEESLRQANETLQALIDYSPLAIIMFDLDSNILLWNNAAETMYGWTAQEVLGKFIPFIPEDKREEQQMIRERVTQGEILKNLELERRRKDGSHLDIGVSVAPLRDAKGSVYAQMSVAADITERKRAEEALRASEERYRNLFEDSPISLLEEDFSAVKRRFDDLRQQGVTDFRAFLQDHPEIVIECMAQVRLVDLNNTAVKMYKAKSKEDLFRNIARVASEESLADFREALIAGAERKTEYGFETVNQALNGDRLWISMRWSVAPGYEETLSRVIVSGIDITERKQAQEEIQRLNAELEQRVIERTAQLEAANKELEAFSYSVSHDLRAPLRAIGGFSRILMEDHAPQLSPEVARYLRIIFEGTQQMGRLIDGLLAFSRLSRQPLGKQLIASADLVRQVLDSLSDELARRRVEISIAELPVRQGDPTLLRQVWMNLLSNALKFTRGRDVARIEVGCTEQDGEQVYFVKDNGAGFDMQYASKLFGVFQRLHSERDFEGTGVRLAIVQRIVRRHGGRVWAEGQVGQGATFYFTLP